MLMTIYECKFLSIHIVTCIFIIEVVRVLLDFTKIHVCRGCLGYVANARGS